MLSWLGNSLLVASVGALVAVAVGLPAGYALARLQFPGRRLLRFCTLLTMVVPNTVLVIPLYLEVSAVGAVNNIWVVALLMGFYPFGVYLTYIHFRTTLPVPVLEAARIDGLSETDIFRRVALPASKPAVALVGFFSFVANWTNFFLPLVLLPLSSSTTISVACRSWSPPARCSTRPPPPGSTCGSTRRSCPRHARHGRARDRRLRDRAAGAHPRSDAGRHPVGVRPVFP